MICRSLTTNVKRFLGVGFLIFSTCVLVPKSILAQSMFSGPVVGQMGSIELTTTQISSLIAAQIPETRKSFSEQPEAIKNLIRNELVRRTVLGEALKAEWDKRSEVIVAMERGKEQAVIDNFVANRSLPPAGYPSEAEIKAAYDANIAQFRVPAQILSLIHI